MLHNAGQQPACQAACWCASSRACNLLLAVLPCFFPAVFNVLFIHCAVLVVCRINHEGLGDKDFSSIYRYIYGAGSTDHEWNEGQQLYSSQVP